MYKKGILLVSFVLSLILIGNIQAEDLNPPHFAGADGWCAAVWEFDIEPPESTHFTYKPELIAPEFLIDGIVERWWDEGTQILDASGEGRFYLPAPESDGGTMTMNIQITWEGAGDVWAFPEVWSAPDGEGGDYLGGNESINPEIINLGDGMWHGTWLGDVSTVGEYVVALIGGEGVAIHELVVDAIVHDGRTPVGTGQRPGAPERGPATNPAPSDEEFLVERDVALSWNPGVYAATHNVYFGTNFDDVNEADTNSALLVSPGQTGTSYDPPGLLDWGKTYYWRIDEVNDPTNPGIYKGKTWSFMVEPYSYDISEHIVALTASSFDPKYEPNNTVNGSGLDADDLHDVNEFNMWLSSRDATEPAWIQYQFDRPYKLHELMVWNYNRFREDRLGFGFKEMLIEHSLDGIDFTTLDPVQLEPATGKEPTGPDVLALNGLVATHIRLSAVSNFMGRNQYGLSEVRILYLPARAREPEPADGAENVLPDIPLQWRPGREADTHDVLIGTDMNDLTLVGDDIIETSFMPELVLSETYYWQVLETDIAGLAGDIWSFTTQDYLVVDDFESYNTTDKQIWETWLDGLGYGIPDTPNFYGGNGTGSAVGDETSPSYMEETIVHTGGKSVPLAYNNTAVSISEITAEISDLSIGPDWTMADIKALTLYIHGSEDNLGGQLYVKVNDERKDQSADLNGEYWQEVNIDLASFGVDLQNVTSITIGIAGAGSSGLVYIDDIRLYPSRCIPQMVPGDLTGDCIVDEEDLDVIADNWLKRPLAVEYTFDTGLSDTSGNNRNGIGQNNPSVANGILTLNGNNFVDIPLGADNPFDGSRDFSIAMDFKTDFASLLLSSARDNDRDNHSMSVFVHHWDQPYAGEVLYDNYTVGAATVEDDPVDGQWHNVVVTYDAGSELFIVYLDGVAGEAVEMNPAIPDIAADTVRIGGSLNSSYPYNEDVLDLIGDIDNIRIFNFTLTPADIFSLPAIPTAPADLNGDGIVDQADRAIVEANMGPEKLWP